MLCQDVRNKTKVCAELTSLDFNLSDCLLAKQRGEKNTSVNIVPGKFCVFLFCFFACHTQRAVVALGVADGRVFTDGLTILCTSSLQEAQGECEIDLKLADLSCITKRA